MRWARSSRSSTQRAPAHDLTDLGELPIATHQVAQEAWAAGRTLADKLNHLFQTVHPGQSEPFSARQVAAAITAQAEERGDAKYEITHSYISLLRRRMV